MRIQCTGLISCGYVWNLVKKKGGVPVGVFLGHVAPVAKIKVITHVAVHPSADDQTLALVTGKLHADHLVVISVALGLHPTWGKNNCVRWTRQRAPTSASFQTQTNLEASAKLPVGMSGVTGTFWRAGRSVQWLRAHHQYSRHRPSEPRYHGPIPPSPAPHRASSNG